jgi:hypothetical protein
MAILGLASSNLVMTKNKGNKFSWAIGNSTELTPDSYGPIVVRTPFYLAASIFSSNRSERNLPFIKP